METLSSLTDRQQQRLQNLKLANLLNNTSLNTPPISPVEDTRLENSPFTPKTVTFTSLRPNDGIAEHTPITPPTYLTYPTSRRNRFTLAEAPHELLVQLPQTYLNLVATSSATPANTNTNIKNHKILPRNHRRKNPYPKRSPDKASIGIQMNPDIFSIFQKDPKGLLEENLSELQRLKQKSPSYSILPIHKPDLTDKKTRRVAGSSLARAMVDRGADQTPIQQQRPKDMNISKVPLPSLHSTDVYNTYHELNRMQLDNLPSSIQQTITWKGNPLKIEQLPHYNLLHQAEAQVASTLRLTPVQYLTVKHVFISTARRYYSRGLPFLKSDAQKIMKMDVNKSCKMWDFFNNVGWI
ncbi:5300_t:CDS:1 [Ambispora gerdemannii]|uniref:5300_t:CDS:1 n=1 Tax=Ambispora gerdemannii TaxID=144530 RepID=A0A9N8UWG0_9GLOM|nr:5300_t:CDS:1 [Ambispora gerdemannii]